VDTCADPLHISSIKTQWAATGLAPQDAAIAEAAVRVLQEARSAQDASMKQVAVLEAVIKGGEEQVLQLTQQREKAQAELTISEREVIRLLVGGGLLKARVEDDQRQAAATAAEAATRSMQLASSEGQVAHLVASGALLKAKVENSEQQVACLGLQLECSKQQAACLQEQLEQSDRALVHLVVKAAFLNVRLQAESVIRENERQVCLLAIARQLNAIATCRS
jgi:hypothetical protein